MSFRAIEDVSAAVYTVPTDAPEADGTLRWSETTLTIVTVRSGDTSGLGWTYGPAAVAVVVRDVLAPLVTGRSPLAVPGTWAAMQRALRNATRPGIAGYALSAVDVALWDLKARLLDLPVADLIGRVHDAVPVYGSGGFTSYTDQRLASQLEHWVGEQSIPRVKIKIGEAWGERRERDLERIRLARRVIGPDAELYVDANGAYGRKQAVRVLRDAADSDVTWFEEPVSSDDLAGLAAVRSAVRADVAAGEYGSDIGYFRRMCAADAVDCLQIDATRCGGYTEWLRSAGVAASYSLPVSGHCAPNLHATVATCTPNVRHLEWFHDHVRIEEMFFEGALDPAGGVVTSHLDRPGHGLDLRAGVALPYRVA